MPKGDSIMKDNSIHRIVCRVAVLAAMSVLTAKMAFCDVVSDYAIGVEFGGSTLRLACYESGKIADIDVPIG